MFQESTPSPRLFRLPDRTRWRRARRGLALTLLVALLAYVTANVAGGRQIAVELERMRAEGAPLSLREAAPAAVPEEENAAVVYEQAYLALPRLERRPGQSAEIPPRQSKADEEVLGNLLSEVPSRRARVTTRQAKQALAGTDAAMALARRAAAMPRCRFPVDWEAGAAALLPHLGKLTSLTRLLGGHAVIAAREGRTAEAAADLEAIAGLVGHVGVDPLLVGQLVQYACLSHGGIALQQVTEAASLEEAHCRRLEARLARIDFPTRFLRSLEMERCLGLWAFDTVRHDPHLLTEVFGDQAGLSAGLHRMWVVLAEPFLKWDEIAYLRIMAHQVAVAREAPPIPPGGAAGYPPKVGGGADRTAPLTDAAIDGRPPLYAMITRLMLPALASATAKRDIAIARLTMLRTALGLEACRAGDGEYPASLEEAERRLGRALPRDPFTGAPFRYQRRDRGYLLYSLGVNRRDDGGSAHRRVTEGTLPTPEPRAVFQPRPGDPDDIALSPGQ